MRAAAARIVSTRGSNWESLGSIGHRMVMGLSTGADVPILSRDCCIFVRLISMKNAQLVSNSNATFENPIMYPGEGSKPN